MPRVTSRTTFMVVLALVSGACASAPRPTPDGSPSLSDDSGPRWTPAAGADESLKALLAADPFTLPAASLAVASGGRLARMHEREILLFDSQVRVDAEGRATTTERTVWRILKDAPDQTFKVVWSPWRQRRPSLKARVVSSEGEETWVQSTNVVEGSVQVDGLELSDARILAIALPHARLGSVIELEVTRVDTQPLLDGGGAMGGAELWGLAAPRLSRFLVEVPSAAPLKVEVIGVDPPAVLQEGTVKRVRLEVPSSAMRFDPFSLSRTETEEKRPRFIWTTAPSWELVARGYEALLAAVMQDTPDLSTLTPLVRSARSRTEKAQRAVRWLAERVRYTALHLGAGAIVPTAPSAVLSRGYGDCKDLSTLLLLALRRHGVPARLALTTAGTWPARDGLPGLAAFNHMIVAVALENGETLWVDPTTPSYPVGVLPRDDRDARALLIAPETRGLVATQSRAQTPFHIKETFELRLASFGEGKGTVTREHHGAAEGLVRSWPGGLEESVARDFLHSSVHLVLGQVEFQPKISGARPGDGPVVFSADVPSAPQLETSDSDVSVRLASLIMTVVLPTDLLGSQPGSDTRTPEQKRAEEARAIAQTGLSPEQTEEKWFQLDSRLSAERVLRVHLPPRFVVSRLPAPRTLEMGPSTLVESFTQLDARTVEARFTFRTEKTDWSPQDLRAFRDAYWKYAKEPEPQVVAQFEPHKLLHEKRGLEAAALATRWLEETPSDAQTRARYARLLLGMGLGEVARDEVERALRDAPEDPLVLMVCADVARNDALGRLYEPPFQRAKALSCIRKALDEAPSHLWAAALLADTLRRDDNGEPVRERTPDVLEAARLLEGFIEQKRYSEPMGAILGAIYFATGSAEPMKKLMRTLPTADTVEAATTREALANGVDDAARRIMLTPDRESRLRAMVSAWGAFAAMRRYDEASQLLSKLSDDSSLGTEIARMRAVHTTLRAAPRARSDLRSPEAAARSVFALIANASTMTEASRALAGLASDTGRAELNGKPEVLAFGRLPALAHRLSFDLLYHRGQCTTSGRDGLSRVYCEIPENRALNATSYWRQTSRGLRLESLGRASQLAMRAWTNVKGKRFAAAAQWLDWLADDFRTHGTNENRSAELLIDLWQQAKRDDPSALTLSASLARVLFAEGAREAPRSVIDELSAGRRALTGGLGRRLDAELVRTHQTRGELREAAQVLHRLATSEDETWMWQWLVELESKAGQSQEAMKRVRAALERSAGDPQWLIQRALVTLRSGEHCEAASAFDALARDTRVDTRAERLLAHVLCERLDDEDERVAPQLLGSDDASGEALLSASLVLLERGLLLEGANAAAARLRRIGGRSDASQWLLRGRLLQRLGFPAASALAYGRMGTVELPEVAALAARHHGTRARR